MEKDRGLVRSWGTDSGIVIAGLTLFVYFCALSHQKGYLHYFNIPIEYISLAPTIILEISLQLIAGVGAILLGFFFLSIPIDALIISLKDKLTRLLERLLGPPRPRNPSFALPDRLAKAAVRILVVFTAILSLFAYVNYAGKYEAKNREEFFVVAGYPGLPESLVVFQITDEYIITAPVDRSTREVEKKIYVLKVSEMGQTPITHEKLGKLKVKQ